ncbi:CocE/NonD family hydrolase [Tenacibaculum sp. ZS6-P6]|uniref:CocE/NonD family hydrolase n=1 Tax=Tenacibaculum sp. ZS6-P6 TaxID=3447503 RepID=UPI003F9CDB0A
MITRKKLLLLFITVLYASTVLSQKVYFPKKISTDLGLLDKEMKKVSQFVLSKNKPDSTTSYYFSLFHVQFLDNKFDKAQETIDNYIEAHSINRLKEGAFFLYNTYAKAKELSSKGNINFNKAYTDVFLESYKDLKDVLKPEVTRSINDEKSLSEFKEDVVKLLKEYEDKDSLSIEEATKLCTTYNTYKVQKEIGGQANKLLEKADEEFFNITKDVVIKTKNGGEVTALIITKKDTKQKLPAIFIYNIYAGSYDYEVAKRAAVNGYVGVVVNTRGKRLSKNEINPFEFDGADAYHIIDWISKQKWCNGSIGMMGGSYLGFSQWSATKKTHPALKTIIPQVAVGIGVDYPMHNNVFMSYMLQWIKYVDSNKFTNDALFRDYKKWDKVNSTYYEKGLAFNTLDSLLNGKKNPIFQRWLSHPSYDSYWQNMIPYKNEFKNINIPVLTTTGYYDADQVGALDYFNKHYKYNTNANHYLVIGPYSHGGGQHYPTKKLMKYTLDETALISIHELAYQWFDFILKGKEKPALLKDKINYQVMGANEWRHAKSFDEINANPLKLYLTNVTNGDAYKMTTNKPKHNGHISYEVDLSTREKTDKHGVFSYNIVNSEVTPENALSFISEPFEKEVTLTGLFNGEMTIISNKKDVDLAMTFYEIQPDGSYFLLSDTHVFRVSYARNNEKRQLLEPYKPYAFPVKRTFMTSKKIKKGSKLFVVIGVNKSKSWEINYGTGKPVSEETIKDAGEPVLLQILNKSYITIGSDSK